MAHTYASVAQLLRFQGDSTRAEGAKADLDALALGFLEGASRRVEGFCKRSYGARSGFGPRLGINYYDRADGDGEELWFDDDLLEIVAATALVTFGGTPAAVAEGTDGYLAPDAGPPYRSFRLHGYGNVTSFAPGPRFHAWSAKWGHADSRIARGTLSAAINDTETTVTFSTAPSAGETLYIDEEQIYVRVGGATPTLERGANGTTAASHLINAPVELFTYHAGVHDASLEIAARRWKSRDAGGSGTTYGGGPNVPVTGVNESEEAICWSHLRELKFMGVS